MNLDTNMKLFFKMSNRGIYMITLNLYFHKVLEISVELFIISVYFGSEKVTTYLFSVLKSFSSF